MTRLIAAMLCAALCACGGEEYENEAPPAKQFAPDGCANACAQAGLGDVGTLCRCDGTLACVCAESCTALPQCTPP